MFEQLFKLYGGGRSVAPRNVALGMYDLNVGTPALVDAYRYGGLQGVMSTFGTKSANLMGNVNALGDAAAKNQAGLMAGLGLLQGGFDTWNTFQNNRNAEKALNWQKQVYERNYQNQRKMTNMELSDRQDRRVAATGMGPTETAVSREEYMKNWGV